MNKTDRHGNESDTSLPRKKKVEENKVPSIRNFEGKGANQVDVEC